MVVLDVVVEDEDVDAPHLVEVAPPGQVRRLQDGAVQRGAESMICGRMSSQRLREEQARFFAQTFAEHGATGRGVDWKDDAAQTLRFEQLLRPLDTRAEFTINDYGCGWGALIPFLDSRRLHYRYCGYDIAEPLLAYARSRYQSDGRCSFVTDDSELPVADYTVASGIFNRPFSLSHDEWTQH